MPDKLRICMIPPADLLIESGSTLYSKAIINELIERGHKVSVLCTNPDLKLKANYILVPNLLPHPYDDNQATKSSVFYECVDMSYRALIPYLETNQFDIIHSIYPSFNGIAASLATCFYPVASVVSCLGRIINLAAELDDRYKKMARCTFSNISYIIAANEEIRDKIVAQYLIPSGEIKILPMAADLSCFLSIDSQTINKHHDIKEGLRILSICSCISEEKGIEDVIRALSSNRIINKLKYKFTIIGPDPIPGEPYLNYLKELAIKLGVEDNIEFKGFIPHEKIPYYLNDSDLFIDSRRVGNFSTVILEALATGSAIISSNVKGNTQLIKHFENGLIFEAGNIQSLEENLLTVLENPEILSKFRIKSKEWFHSHSLQYQYDNHIDELEKIYFKCKYKNK